MSKLRAGDWVEVRSKEEILRSLDKSGRLEGMPFMPQMFQFCGQRFKVYKRAHKTCDTVNSTGGRRLADGIHLDHRCDGKAYGGCEAACLIFWKEAWLKPLDENASSPQSVQLVGARVNAASNNEPSCGEQDVLRATRTESAGDTRYSCQATELPSFTQPLAWWDARQYLEDYSAANVSLGRITLGFIYLACWHIGLAKRGRIGRPVRWLYDRFQALRGGVPFPRRAGTIPADEITPGCNLNLQRGELVRVKSFEEIRATIDTQCKNRGLGFEAELVPYCGGTYRVRARVNNFIDEKTGKMKTMKTPAVILEGVWCQSRYSNRRMFCPRSIYSWWREIWLERVPEEKPIVDKPTYAESV